MACQKFSEWSRDSRIESPDWCVVPASVDALPRDSRLEAPPPRLALREWNLTSTLPCLVTRERILVPSRWRLVPRARSLVPSWQSVLSPEPMLLLARRVLLGHTQVMNMACSCWSRADYGPRRPCPHERC